MFDGCQRKIDYLRLSVTDRCNLRCVYCMPKEGVEKLCHGGILSYEEIITLCRIFSGLGINKIRITGGEPLVRRDVCRLVGALKRLDGIKEVTLTTNGTLLVDHAKRLRDAGLNGINISLDSLDPARYQKITRVGNLSDALAGLDAALDAGLSPVKINCVPMPGYESDVIAVAALARDRDVKVRFIEMMPIGLGKSFERLETKRVVQLLESEYGPAVAYKEPLGNGPAHYWSLPGFLGQIGLIGAVSRSFCEKCNRVRLTADGFLKTCLCYDCGENLIGLLRQKDNNALNEAVARAVWQKPRAHVFLQKQSRHAERRIMSQIGG